MRAIIITIIFLPFLCYSQKQANIWYFGDHAGIDFNSGSPITLTNGQTSDNVGEGSAVICDSLGQLLFYTNGNKIWNRNQQVMMNGDFLLSNFSSTQSSLIIPLPGSTQLFYLFTTDDFDISNLQYGFRYSIIDMCLDNGLGAVVSGQKNILLLDTVAEKLTAVRHKNGIDYWVIVHKYYSDAFYAYRFTNNGIMDTVVTHLGSTHNASSPNPSKGAIGYMKASPNGGKLALATLNRSDNIRELFDFNDSSGIVSNFIDLEPQVDTFGGYGVSFSPDNSKLYIASNSPGKIYQYEITAGGGDPDSIIFSKIKVVDIQSAILGLQLGPDGKIYVALTGTSFLAVINNPDQTGLNCNFQNNAVSLNNKVCGMGLPNIIDSYSYSNSIASCITNISENRIHNNFSVSPNPFNQYTTIQFENGKKEICSITLYNTQGQVVLSITNFKTDKVEIDRGNLISGLYFFKVCRGEQIIANGKIAIE